MQAGGPGSGPDYLTLLVNQVEGTAWLKGWASAQPAAKALAAAAAQREAAAVAGRDEALGMLQQAEQELANCIDKLRALAEERDRYIASEVTQVKVCHGSHVVPSLKPRGMVTGCMSLFLNLGSRGAAGTGCFGTN